MPPIRYQNPPQIFAKAPLSPIYGQKEPEIRIGKTLVAAGPRSLRMKHYRMIKTVLKATYGQRQQNIIDFYPTRGLCRRLPETKYGCGQGDVKDFLARIPAGKVLVHVPNIVPFNNFEVQHNITGLNHLSQVLPNRCIVRSQFNHFKGNSLKQMQDDKLPIDRKKIFAEHRASLRCNTHRL